MRKIIIKLNSIEHTGDPVGQNISLKGSIDSNNFEVSEKRIPKHMVKKYGYDIVSLVINDGVSRLPVALSVVERDIIWSDKGRSETEIQVPQTGTDTVVIPVTVVERWWLFLKRKAVFLVSLIIVAQNSSSENNARHNIQEYLYTGVSGTENYNQHDELIWQAVVHWNKQFTADTDPPKIALDPNLVKAICYQESRVGNDPRVAMDIMQVGHPDDPAMKTLQGKLTEYWLHKGELQSLHYSNAEVKSVYDSVYWGVRWLYHKAQRIDKNNKRVWGSWNEAVKRYGPGTQKYVDDVWGIYTKGVKKEGHNLIKLWSLILLPFFLASLLGGGHIYGQFVQTNIFQVHAENRKEIIFSPFNNNLMAVIDIDEEDWWERISVFRNGKKVVITEAPSEQSIYSTRFVRMKDRTTDFLEVYGITHQGHGNFYLYEITEDRTVLKAKIKAVDTNPDIRFSLENRRIYGYNYCGEIIKGNILKGNYRDSILLDGWQLLVCEDPIDPQKLVEVDKRMINVKVL